MGHNLYINDCQDLRDEFMEMYLDEDFVVDKTGQKTVEIIGAQFTANEEAFFGAPNKEYIEREFVWYSTQSLNVNDIPGEIPKIWKDVAAADGTVNSNYGWAVYSDENYGQFNFVLNELINNPLSRRGVIQFNRPSMVYDYKAGGRNDYMCTLAYQFLIRNNSLNLLVFQRSMDAVFGYPNDRAWAERVYHDLYTALKIWHKNLMLGEIVWHAGSVHIYEKQFYLLDYYNETGVWNVNRDTAKKRFTEKAA